MTTKITIELNDEVWTSDEVKLGVARRVFFRPEDQVNPADLLYAVYLKVEDFELGEDFFIPTDFVGARDEAGRVLLETKMKEVMQRTWSRAPEFVATRLGRSEPLPFTVSSMPVTSR
jgi:hypothetical protein